MSVEDQAIIGGIVNRNILDMDLQAQQFLPPQCDHTGMEDRIQGLEVDLADARARQMAEGTDKQLHENLLAMTKDTQPSGEEVRDLRTHSANAVTLAARATLTVPQTPEHTGQNFPDAPDFSGSNPTQLRGWIAQPQMVI